MATFRINYASQCLKRYHDLNVILPVEDSMMMDVFASSRDLKKKKFKTLYLLHGFSGNQNDWMTGTRIQELADYYGIAVVMPAGDNSFYVDGPSAGTNYGEMIGKEIVEFTRNVFPLSRKREDTFIGGLSMGGFGALRNGTFYYNTFSKIVCLSTAFVVDEVADMKENEEGAVGDFYLYQHIFGDLSKLKDSNKDPFWCVKRALKAKKMPELYIAIGSEDMLIEANHKAKEKLTEMGVDFHYHESPGIHNWNFWSTEIEPAIKWLLDMEEEEKNYLC